MNSTRLQRRGELANRVALQLTEWQTATPDSEPALCGVDLGDDLRVSALIAGLARKGVVKIVALRRGVGIETTSFIGRLAVGPLDLTIRPKIAWADWLKLVSFGLRLRGLVRAEHLRMQIEALSLEDLLILEFIAEVRDLIRHGLHREYVRVRARLPIPRGRVDFNAIARRGGIREAAIPSRFTRRSHDSLVNRAILAGLRHAGHMAWDTSLRAEVHQLAHEMTSTVSEVSLTHELVRRTYRAIDRRTRRYLPALRIIELLLEDQTISLESGPEEPTISLPGFALDMNSLWQRILSRVLGEWSEQFTVHDEFGLRSVFREDPEYPVSGAVPSLRPDFAVFKRKQLVTFLDAKYRDLSERSLPREMLYQLALYAIAQGREAAAILYPTTSSRAVEERIQIRQPHSDALLGTVALRPVRLAKLLSLVSGSGASQIVERESFARGLALGSRMVHGGSG